MPTTTWTFDAADGVYKNHALSEKLLEAAALNFRFVPFSQKVESFGKRQGESVTLFHYKELDVPNVATLREDGRVPIDKLEMGTRNITVSEWGRGVQYTSLNEQLAMFDPRSNAQKKLINQMQHVMDNACAAAFAEAKMCFIPTSLTSGTWDTDGTPSTTATANMTREHMGIIRDYMTNDLHVPFYEGDHYIGTFATKALRGLKQDKALEAWNQYLRKGDLIFKSEIGMVEAIRCIEINNESALSNSVGTGGVLGEGFVFGDEAVSRVEVDFPHLRADPNYQGDFGRIKAVIWYGVVSFGITWDTANDREAKIVRVTSA